MTDKARIKIAAGVTALLLAGICAAGLAIRDDQPQAAATAAAPAGETPAPNAEADNSASGEDQDVAAVLQAAIAAASGEDRDVAAVLDAALAAVAGEVRGDDDGNESERAEEHEDDE